MKRMLPMIYRLLYIKNLRNIKYSIVTKWFVFELKTALLIQLSGCRLANNKMDRILKPDSIEWFIEDQAFLLLALPPFPPFPVSKLYLSFSVVLSVAGPVYWRGVGWPSINHSILSDWNHWYSTTQSPYFYTFMEPRNRFQGMDSASLCSMAAGTITLFLLGA